MDYTNSDILNLIIFKHKLENIDQQKKQIIYVLQNIDHMYITNNKNKGIKENSQTAITKNLYLWGGRER